MTSFPSSTVSVQPGPVVADGSASHVRSRDRRLLKKGIQSLFSLLILGLLCYQGQLVAEPINKLVRSVSMLTIFEAVLVYLLIQSLCAYKWLRLAQSLELQGTWGAYVRYYGMGMFASLFLPTAMGGDVTRVWLAAKSVAKQSKNPAARPTVSVLVRSVSAVLAERGTGFAVLLLFVVLGLMVHPELPQQPLWLLGFSGLTVAVLATCLGLGWVLTHRQLSHRIGLDRISRWLSTTTAHQLAEMEAQGNEASMESSGVCPVIEAVWPCSAAIVEAMGFSVVFHVISIALQGWLLQQLGSPVEFTWLMVIYGISVLASMAPLALNGIGVREASTVVMLNQWAGVPVAQATMFSLIWLVVLMVSACFGGLLWLPVQGPFQSRLKVESSQIHPPSV